MIRENLCLRKFPAVWYFHTSLFNINLMLFHEIYIVVIYYNYIVDSMQCISSTEEQPEAKNHH